VSNIPENRPPQGLFGQPKNQKRNHCNIPMGPPDFPTAFKDIRSTSLINRKHRRHTQLMNKSPLLTQKNNEIGVYFFGPGIIGDRLRTMCQQFSDEQLRFIFYQEFSPDYCIQKMGDKIDKNEK